MILLDAPPDSPTTSTSRITPRRWRIALAFAGSYFVVSLAIVWPVVHTLSTTRTLYPEYDPVSAIWANGWVLWALEHAHNPFYSSTVWYPHGQNLLNGPGAVGLAVLFVPLTWIAGPIFSFNVQVLLIPVVTALAMCWCVRPWVRSKTAIFVAGLLWGFSPFLVSSELDGWTNLMFLAAPPLIFYALADLYHFRRHSPRAVGVGLAIVVGAQLTIGTEVMAISAVATVILLVVAAAVSAFRSRELLRDNIVRTWQASRWFALAAIVTVVPTALFMIKGPSPLASWVWPEWLFKAWGAMSYHGLFHGPVQLDPFFPGSPLITPSDNFFGPALVAVLAGSLLLCRRRPVAWFLVVAAALGLWLVRGQYALLHPWTLIWHAPFIHNILQSRFIIIVWFAAAMLLALGLDVVINWGSRFRRGIGVGLAVVVAVVGLSQVAESIFDSLPAVTEKLQLDPAVATLATSHHNPILMTYPPTDDGRAMDQQAVEGFNFTIVGGWGPDILRGSSRELTVREYLNTTVSPSKEALPPVSADAEIASVIRSWHVQYVVSPKVVHYQLNRGYGPPTDFTALMTTLFGRPTSLAGEWVWHLSS